jgi:hypothetical protein
MSLHEDVVPGFPGQLLESLGNVVEFEVAAPDEKDGGLAGFRLPLGIIAQVYDAAGQCERRQEQGAEDA